MQLSDQVGPYRLLREIGRGGMGVVFEAIDARTGQRRALKSLQLPDPRLSRRMEREFRAIARLDHPGVVKVHDYGSFEGQPYLVMDFIDGRTLLDFLDTRPTAERLARTLELVAELCMVLHYIHSVGVVHRDLKPSNVLVDASDRVKLIDFGLVKDQADEDQSLTEAGVLMGTLAYLSPEQIQERRLDGRSDLYSLGILLFELCAGVRPFRAESRMALLRAHLSSLPPKPRLFNAALSERLEHLILQLLEKEPYRRPATGRDVEAVLVAELASLRQSLATETVALGWNPGDLRLEPTAQVRGMALLPPQTRLVGRQQELAELEAELGQAFEGKPRLLVLQGEAGTGKSRMAEEAVAFWRTLGGLVLEGRSHLGDKIAYGLLQPVHRHLEALRGAAQATMTIQTSDETVRAAAAATAQIDPKRMVAELADGLREVLAHEPIALVLEDVHWSDPLSLEAVQSLLRGLENEAGKGLAVVLTFRDKEKPEPLEQLLRWARKERLLKQWTLASLPEAAVSELVSALLGSAVSPYFTAWLFRATGGNPALLEGAVRRVADRGALRRSESGQWSLEMESGAVSLGEFEEAEMPSALDIFEGDAVELAKLKLENLEPAEKELLDAAALLRGEFGLETLAGVLGLDELELLDRLDHLLRRGILAEANKEGDRFRFELEMLRESIAKGLTGPRRLLLYRKIIAGLEKRHGKTPKGQAIIDLAEHAFAGRQEEKALRYGMLAAKELYQQSLFRDAERMYLRLQELLKKENLAALLTPEQRMDILEGLATVKNQRADHTGALTDFAELARLAEESGDQARVARAIRGRTLALLRTGKLDEASISLQHLMSLYSVLDDLGGLGYAYNLKAYFAFMQCELLNAESFFREAVSYYRKAGMIEELAGALYNIGYMIDCCGRYKDAKSVFTEALNLRRKNPTPSIALVRSLTLLAGNSLRRGDIGEARDFIEESELLARKLGDSYGRLDTLIQKAHLKILELKPDEALLLYRQLKDLTQKMEQVDEHRMEAELEICRLEAVHTPENSVREAERLLSEAIALRRSPYIIRSQLALAEAQERLSNIDQARKAAELGLKEARRTGFLWFAPELEALLSRLPPTTSTPAPAGTS